MQNKNIIVVQHRYEEILVNTKGFYQCMYMWIITLRY